MTFTIPNSSQTYDGKQAQLDQADVLMLGAGFNAFGVISGCLATATTSNLVVSVASGIVISGGTKVSVSSGTVTLTSGDAVNPRLDLVVVTTSGALQVNAGTASSAPTFPAIATTSVVSLFAVYVPANATVVSSSQVVDKRVAIAEWDANQPAGRYKNNSASTNYYTIPGCSVVSVSTIASAGAGIDIYEPFFVQSTITVDQLAIELTVASTAGGLLRMGIYQADTDFQPSALVTGSDSGDIATSSVGIRTYTPGTALVLPPGRYLKVFNANNGSLTFRTVRAPIPGNQPIFDALGASIFVMAMTVTRTYGAFTSSGSKWNSAVTGTTPFIHSIFLRVSVP